MCVNACVCECSVLYTVVYLLSQIVKISLCKTYVHHFENMETIKVYLFYFSKNALKLTYGNVQVKKISGGYTPGPPLRGGDGRERRVSSSPHQGILDPPLTGLLANLKR